MKLNSDQVHKKPPRKFSPCIRFPFDNHLWWSSYLLSCRQAWAHIFCFSKNMFKVEQNTDKIEGIVTYVYVLLIQKGRTSTAYIRANVRTVDVMRSHAHSSFVYFCSRSSTLGFSFCHAYIFNWLLVWHNIFWSIRLKTLKYFQSAI